MTTAREGDSHGELNHYLSADASQITIDAANMRDDIDHWWLEAYSQRAGEELMIVGAARDDYLTLLIGTSGAIYGGYGDSFGLLGHSGIQALGRLINDEPYLKDLSLD